MIHNIKPGDVIQIDTDRRVAHELDRRFIGLDLSAEYLAKHALPRAERRTSAPAVAELPLFAGLEG